MVCGFSFSRRRRCRRLPGSPAHAGGKKACAGHTKKTRMDRGVWFNVCNVCGVDASPWPAQEFVAADVCANVCETYAERLRPLTTAVGGVSMDLFSVGGVHGV